VTSMRRILRVGLNPSAPRSMRPALRISYYAGEAYGLLSLGWIKVFM